MAISVSKACVLKIYQDVMEDVIMNVRDLFLEDGVDEQVLQELQQAWEAKLVASKAVDNHPPELDKSMDRKQVPSNLQNNFVRNLQQNQSMKQTLGQVAPNNHVQTSLGQGPSTEVKMVPVQITLPPQPGSDGGQRVLTIQVPSTALQGNQLHRALTGPVISATMSLPVQLASTILQTHVDAVLNSQQQTIPIGTFMNKQPSQNDGADDSSSDDEVTLTINPIDNIQGKFAHKVNMLQIDGPGDTSDDDEEASEDDDGSDEAEDDKEDENDMEDDGGPEEEPLNSEDDVTDEDAADQFDTENVVVCQYDKITRSRNKWKFHLKDGIMNCNNEDYIFQKANGDAEW